MAQDMKELIEILERQGAAHRSIAAPNTVEQAISTGIHRAKASRRSRKHIVWRNSVSVAAALLILFVVSVRMFPAFASAVSQLPGMDRIVQLISHDRGLVAALNNDYYQPVGVSDTHDGLTLTIDGVIRDEGRIVLFYTVSDADTDGITRAVIREPKFRFTDGSYLESGLSYSYMHPGDDFQHGLYTDRIDIQFSDAELPDEFIFEAKLSVNNVMLSSTWEIPMKLRPFSEQDKRTYTLNETVTMEGQKLTFESVTVYPTRIMADVVIDPDNTKEFFSFIDITLVGDPNESYTSYGTIGSGDRQTLIFQGSSFAIPQTFAIRGSKARAVDKDQMQLIIDTEQRRVLQAPDDRVRVKSIAKTGHDKLNVTLALSGVDPDDKMMYRLVSNHFTDAVGTGYDMDSLRQHSFGSEEEHGAEQTLTFYIPNKEYDQPLTFSIESYPGYIYEPFEIRVK